MKALYFSSLLALFFSVVASAAPSRLSDCSSDGWSLRRIGVDDALEFTKLAQGCAAKFSIQPDHDQIHNGWRAELEDPLRLKQGAYTSYEFYTYIPEQLKGPGIPNLVFAQWHDNKVPGVAAKRPPFSIRLRDGQIVLPLFNQSVIDQQGLQGQGLILFSQPAPFEQWVRWRVRAIWSHEKNGLLEVWMNNKKVVDYHGPTGYEEDITSPYFKIGIYTTESFDKPLWVFHKAYRRTFAEADPYKAYRSSGR